MKTLTITVLLVASICVGCVMPRASNELVPKTVVEYEPKTGKFHGEFPKDANIGGAEIRRETNGTISVLMTNVNAKMNPDVVTASGAAQAAQIQAIADLYKIQAEFMRDTAKQLLEITKALAK